MKNERHMSGALRPAAKIRAAACSAVAVLLGTPMSVMADSFSAYSGSSGTEIVDSLADSVGNVATYIGIIFVIVGVLSFFIAFRNEDSEGKNRAGISIAAGIGLLGFTSIIKLFV